MSKISIVLADDHVLVRKGIVAMLESEQEIEVVGEAGNGSEALASAKSLHPDILLLDHPHAGNDRPRSSSQA